MNKEMLHKLHAVNTNIFAQFLYKKFSILNYLFTCSYFAEVSNLHRKHAALTNHSRVKPLSIANESLSGVRTEFFFLNSNISTTYRFYLSLEKEVCIYVPCRKLASGRQVPDQYRAETPSFYRKTVLSRIIFYFVRDTFFPIYITLTASLELFCRLLT
jgi:hypothetical protein